MLDIFCSIIPVFAVILLGWLLRARNFLPASLIQPLNQMVFYIAIPALVFREVANAPFRAHFQPLLLAGTLLPVLAVFGLALAAGLIIAIPRAERGTFLQSSFHGNLGYIGLAVAYYLLGTEGFTSAGILAAFAILLQNFLSVVVLQVFPGHPDTGRRPGYFWRTIFANPVIASALAGIVFSVLRLPLPAVADRSLEILSSMALPLALLVIGGSLSIGLIKSYLPLALGAGVLKLVVLPAVGIWFYRLFELPPETFFPGLILLAAPTASITYVMAKEMDGSAPLASAAVTLNTLLSAGTFVLWLGIFK
jgi:predicted permease